MINAEELTKLEELLIAAQDAVRKIGRETHPNAPPNPSILHGHWGTVLVNLQALYMLIKNAIPNVERVIAGKPKPADDAKVRQWVQEYQEIDADTLQEILDDLVDDCKGEERAAINNQGFDGQLAYLLTQHDADDLLAMLQEADKEATRGL